MIVHYMLITGSPWQYSLIVHRHPLTVSTALRARNFKDIIFVTDSVMEPKEGATVNYINRKCTEAMSVCS